MKKLQEIVAGVVLVGTLGVVQNVRSYLDARSEVMAAIQRETQYDPTTLSGRLLDIGPILDMNSCEKIVGPYKQELRDNDFVFFLRSGRRYLLQQYVDDCISSSNVGVI